VGAEAVANKPRDARGYEPYSPECVEESFCEFVMTEISEVRELLLRGT
jgi:hypothetical protein